MRNTVGVPSQSPRCGGAHDGSQCREAGCGGLCAGHISPYGLVTAWGGRTRRISIIRAVASRCDWEPSRTGTRRHSKCLCHCLRNYSPPPAWPDSRLPRSPFRRMPHARRQRPSAVRVIRAIPARRRIRATRAPRATPAPRARATRAILVRRRLAIPAIPARRRRTRDSALVRSPGDAAFARPPKRDGVLLDRGAGGAYLSAARTSAILLSTEIF